MGEFLYAICLNTADTKQYEDDWWIEFYWAEDMEQAEKEAENEHPNCAIVCAAPVPH